MGRSEIYITLYLYDHYYVLKSLHCASTVTEIYKTWVHYAERRRNDLTIQVNQKVHMSNGIYVIWVHLQKEIVQIKYTYSDTV